MPAPQEVVCLALHASQCQQMDPGPGPRTVWPPMAKTAPLHLSGALVVLPAVPAKTCMGAPSSWSPPSSRPPRRGCAQLCVWCLFLSHESAAEAVGTRPRAQTLGQMPVSGVMGTRPQTPRGARTPPLAAESLSFSHVRGHLLLGPCCCLSVCLWSHLRVGCM